MVSESRPCATDGHIGAMPPQITSCAPHAKGVPPSESYAPKQSNRPGATGVHFRACAPQNSACAPPQA